MIEDRTPVLMGCGQITDTIGAPSSERSTNPPRSGVYGKTSPERAWVLGRLDETGDRFVAMAPPSDRALLDDMLTREQLGRKISMSGEGNHNVFRLA